MIIFEIIGVTTVLIIIIKILHTLYRYFIPKKYKWNNCPNNHDTMARCGVSMCDKCKNEL